MHNFIEKFTKINDICKKFAGNRVNEHGNVSRRGVIPTFSDLEVIALSLTAEAFGYDSENNLFKRLAESPEHIPNLISRRQFNVRRKLTACLAEDIRRDIAKSIFWFEKFRKGDMRDMEHQRQIIDTFVNSVYVFDDRVVLNFNFTDDAKTVTREEVLGSSAVDNVPTCWDRTR